MPTALAKKHRSNGLLTVADYMALPDDGNRYELVHGELLISPSAYYGHGAVTAFIAGKLGEFVRRRKLGSVSVEIDIMMDDDLVLRPDVTYVARGRESIIRGHLHGPPDLAAEITSPGNWQMDIFAKMHEYQRFGIREYWALDIVDRRYRAYQWYLRGKRYQGGLVDGRVIKSRVLKGFTLKLEEVWAIASGQ